jgi:4-amino-4-deoxy-L-arabinose transferase-like glycosyltransferase
VAKHRLLANKKRRKLLWFLGIFLVSSGFLFLFLGLLIVCLFFPPFCLFYLLSYFSVLLPFPHNTCSSSLKFIYYLIF